LRLKIWEVEYFPFSWNPISRPLISLSHPVLLFFIPGWLQGVFVFLYKSVGFCISLFLFHSAAQLKGGDFQRWFGAFLFLSLFLLDCFIRERKGNLMDWAMLGSPRWAPKSNPNSTFLSRYKVRFISLSLPYFVWFFLLRLICEERLGYMHTNWLSLGLDFERNYGWFAILENVI
jgi:hypothetical protein